MLNTCGPRDYTGDEPSDVVNCEEEEDADDD